MNYPIIRQCPEETIQGYEIFPYKNVSSSYSQGMRVYTKGWAHTSLNNNNFVYAGNKALSSKLYQALVDIVRCMSDNLQNYLSNVKTTKDPGAYKFVIGPNWWEIYTDNVCGNLVGKFHISCGNNPYNFLSVRGYDRFDSFKPIEADKFSTVHVHYISEQEYLKLVNFIDNSTHRLVELFAAVFEEAKIPDKK